MAWVLRVSPERSAPWIPAFVFGGIVLTAAGVFVVDPLRGIWPSGNMLPRLAVGFAANAMWGWGALVFMRAFMAGEKRRKKTARAAIHKKEASGDNARAGAH